MSAFSDVIGFSRLAIDLRSFLRDRLTLDEARTILRRRLEQREANFLRMVERTIFGNPTSPYKALLAMAGCEFGDLRDMVRVRGVEATLRALRKEDVYVSFEEFKGREPIVRRGRRLPAADFSNPSVRHHFSTESSGSTGAGTRVSNNLARLANSAPYHKVSNDAYGLSGAPTAIWRGLLPAVAGLNSLLIGVSTDEVAEKWFTPLGPRDLASSNKFPLATYGIIAMARLHGTRLPWPEKVGFDRADIVARWASAALKRHGRCHVKMSASMALRVCLAAQAEGIDLTGATFSGGGEPMTPAKAQGIGRAGARSRPTYYCADVGAIGVSCANPIDSNDQHSLTDLSILIQHPRRVPGFDFDVEAFCVTSLASAASKVVFNVELDDYGVVEERSCGCPFEALGFTRHIREIYSYRKLTGEGVTLVGSDMIRVLEEVLPARFGGSPLDYQLSEYEDASGFTRLDLTVSDRVGTVDEAAVVDAVMRALDGADPGRDQARATWKKAGTVRVRRAEPVWTDRGKLMPLRLERRSAALAAAGDNSNSRTR